MTEIPRNLKNDQNTPYFGLLFRFQSILVIFQVLGYFDYIWVSRVFWSFFKKKCFKGILVMFYVYGVFFGLFLRFRGCFGHILVLGGISGIFQVQGVSWSFSRLKGFFGHFLGLGDMFRGYILVILFATLFFFFFLIMFYVVGI